MSRAFSKERDDAPEPELVLPKRRIIGEVPAPPVDRSVVGFGAHVVVEGVADEPREFTIVDVDQSDVARGRIGIDSPLAQALLGKRAGRRAVWRRPAGDRTLKIVSIAYDEGSTPIG